MSLSKNWYRNFIVFFSLILLLSCIDQEQQLGNDKTELTLTEVDIPEEYLGTYLPVEYLDLLSEYKSHAKALFYKDGDYFDVLAVSESENGDIVYINNLFYDQGAVYDHVFEHNWTLDYSELITDQNGNQYKKISSNTEYYEIVTQLVLKTISDSNKSRYESNGHYLEIKNDSIILDDIKYLLSLDGTYYSNSFDIFYTRDPEIRRIGLEFIDSEVTIFEVEDTSAFREFNVIELYKLN